jgi:hypothetical protein
MGLKKNIVNWLGVFVLAMLACAANAQSKEYQIKAAFLYNFAQFVDWPSAAFANTNAPFNIGILGDDPFDGSLDATIQDETINGHKIVAIRSQRIEDLKNCQIIFVCKSEKKRIAEILTELDSKPILTVSEIDGFAQRGGNINFFLAGTKVRFEINPGAAQSDGLKISSQLLSLGKIVQSGGGDK